MRWSGIPLLSIPRGMEQPGREKQCLSERGVGPSWRCLLAAPSSSCPLCTSLGTASPVPRCSIVGPALLGALVCSVALAGGRQTTPALLHLLFSLLPEVSSGSGQSTGESPALSFWCCCLLNRNEVFHLCSPNTLMPSPSPSATVRGAPKHEES